MTPMGALRAAEATAREIQTLCRIVQMRDLTRDDTKKLARLQDDLDVELRRICGEVRS